jgi:hypothetical protein
MRTRLLLPSLGMLLALAFGACGSTAATPPSQEQAEQAVCASIATMRVEIRKLDALDPSTATVEDVQRQEAAIRGAWSAVQASVQAVGVADKTAVLAAGQAFQATVDGMSPGMSAADRGATIHGALAPLQATFKQMEDGLGCAGAATSPDVSAPDASPSFSRGDY